MKKLISVLLSILLMLSIIPINVFAIENDSYGGIDISQYTDSELDLTQYTMDDIINMTAEEYLDLVAEFERVYNPYNSYVETETESENLSMMSIEDEMVSPQWTSGTIKDGEWTETGCHEYITSVACVILKNDKGFFTDQAAAAVVIMLSISLASLLPDKDETSGIFAGHFYNPETGKSFNGSTSNTAKNNAVNHYNAAVNAANAGAMDQAYEHLGRCLHYVQDVNVPHHAANVISTGPLSSHSQFEDFAFENMETYLGSYSSISSSYYTTANNSTIASLTHNAAVSAKSKIENVNSIFDKTKWETNARDCLKSAARYSAMVMYKFSRVSSVPFYSN